jgi:hypothetical protein
VISVLGLEIMVGTTDLSESFPPNIEHDATTVQ